MDQFNFKGMQVDQYKLKQFKDFLNFALQKNKSLCYYDFQKNCGLSRAQWEQFKAQNIESHNKWSVE